MVYFSYLHSIHTNCQINVNIYLISSFFYLFYLFRPYQSLNYFPTAVKSSCPLFPIPPSFLYNIYILLSVFLSWVYMKYFPLVVKPTTNRSIMFEPYIFFLLIHPFSIDLELSKTLFYLVYNRVYYSFRLRCNGLSYINWLSRFLYCFKNFFQISRWVCIVIQRLTVLTM